MQPEQYDWQICIRDVNIGPIQETFGLKMLQLCCTSCSETFVLDFWSYNRRRWSNRVRLVVRWRWTYSLKLDKDGRLKTSRSAGSPDHFYAWDVRLRTPSIINRVGLVHYSSDTIRFVVFIFYSCWVQNTTSCIMGAIILCGQKQIICF